MVSLAHVLKALTKKTPMTDFNQNPLQQQLKAQQSASRSIRLQNEKRKKDVRQTLYTMLNKTATMYD